MYCKIKAGCGGDGGECAPLSCKEREKAAREVVQQFSLFGRRRRTLFASLRMAPPFVRLIAADDDFGEGRKRQLSAHFLLLFFSSRFAKSPADSERECRGAGATAREGSCAPVGIATQSCSCFQTPIALEKDIIGVISSLSSKVLMRFSHFACHAGMWL